MLGDMGSCLHGVLGPACCACQSPPPCLQGKGLLQRDNSGCSCPWIAEWVTEHPRRSGDSHVVHLIIIMPLLYVPCVFIWTLLQWDLAAALEEARRCARTAADPAKPEKSSPRRHVQFTTSSQTEEYWRRPGDHWYLTSLSCSMYRHGYFPCKALRGLCLEMPTVLFLSQKESKVSKTSICLHR